MKVFNFTKKMNVKTFLLALAFLGLSMSAAKAQNTYNVYNDGMLFDVACLSTSHFAFFPTLQLAIEHIREDAAGNPCTIQFGEESFGQVLDMGGGNTTLITFENSATHTWGKITLTGKATTACASSVEGVIKINDPVSIECKAEITATADGKLFVNMGTLTISGGTIGNQGMLIDNSYIGTLIISGGEISTTGGAHAVLNGNEVTISGGTISATKGTAVFNRGGNITISGGEISATGEGGLAVLNYEYGTLTINNGTIFATEKRGRAVLITNGTTTINGGTISANGEDGSAVVKQEGTLIINNGTISTTGASCGAVSCGTGMLTINNGTISANGASSYAVFTRSTTTINGGTISANGASGRALVVVDAEATIYNGEISATADGTFAMLNEGYGVIDIRGGRISGSGTGVLWGNPSGMIVNADNGKLFMSGGTIECTSNYGNTIVNEKTIEISGGTVTSKGGEAIKNNHDDAQLTITGNAKVLAQEGYAVANTKGTVNIQKNSIVFAYGTEDTDIIQGNYTRSNNAVIAAWENTVGTTAYTAGTSTDIYKLPEAATAVWAKQGSDNGISVKYGGTDGFIPIAGVTVGTTGIESNKNDEFGITVYPNPTTGVFEIKIAGQARNDVQSVEIYDVYGRKISSHHLITTSSNHLIDISNLSSGIYFVTLHTETGKVVRKVVKE